MRKIGILVAVEDEALEWKFGKGKRLDDLFKTTVYNTRGYTMYAVHSGAGEIFAAAATQRMIDCFSVDTVVNFGIAGACAEELKDGGLCIVRDVVHYQHDVSEVDQVETGRYSEFESVQIHADISLIEKASSALPDASIVVCASGDKFVAKPYEKLSLSKNFGAAICDMEAAGVLVTCRRNNVPCLIIKAVSDDVKGGVSAYWANKQAVARQCAEAVAKVLSVL